MFLYHSFATAPELGCSDHYIILDMKRQIWLMSLANTNNQLKDSKTSRYLMENRSTLRSLLKTNHQQKMDGMKLLYSSVCAMIQDFSRQSMKLTDLRLKTVFCRWLTASIKVRTMPLSGFELERFVSIMVARTMSISPGHTGRIQRISSIPGEPRLDTGEK